MDFEDFVESHADELVRFAYLTTGDAQLAEDLTQSALLRAFQRWSEVASPRAYVRRAIVNSAIDRGRRKIREIPTDPSIVTTTDVRDTISDSADPFPLWEHIQLLPPRQRAVLVLRYYEDLDDAGVAEVLEIRESTVRSAAARALASLRTAVETSSQESERTSNDPRTRR